MIEDEELVRRAASVVNPRRLSDCVEVGGVGCALVTDRGNVYVGVCIDTASSMGFCAEHNAIGNMITNGESRIAAIVAVNWDRARILSPCGRCRELIYQVNFDNAATKVILPGGRTKTLQELLPDHWLAPAHQE